MDWINFIVKPLLILLLGILFRNLYFYFNNPRRFLEQDNSAFKYLKNPPVNEMQANELYSQSLNPIFFKLLPILLLAICIFASLFFPFASNTFEFVYPFSLYFILLFIILIPILEIFLILSSQHPSKIQTASHLISNIIQYLFPIILSFIALLITLNNSILNGQHLSLTVSNLVEFQQNFTFNLFGITWPTLFILVNPFAFLAFATSLIGYYRETNFDITYKGNLPNQWNLDMEYSGKQKGLILITRSIQFFLLITMIFPVFFGTYWFGNNFWLNLLVICGHKFNNCIYNGSCGKRKAADFIGS